MKIQKMYLDNGWYPKKENTIKKTINSYIKNYKQHHNNYIGAIVPHAGWFFSGKLTARTIHSLNIQNSKLIVLFGGHLLENEPILYYNCDAFQTPLGTITQNKTILNSITSKLKQYCQTDTMNDNSIEVILPFIKFFAPNTSIIALRTPPSKLAQILGTLIAKETAKLNINTKFIASSDLTHYGKNYNLYHINNINDALKWVQETNDKNFIKLLINMEGNKAIEHAKQNHSSCSSGACAATIYACKTLNKNKGQLIEYYTSYHIQKAKNFVGYAGVIF